MAAGTLGPMDPTSTAGGPSRFWAFALVAVFVTAGIVVGIVVYGPSNNPRADGSAGTERTDPTDAVADESTVLASSDEDISAVIEELSLAASEIRGLPFLEPVAATFLSDEDFRTRLAADLDRDLESGEILEVEWAWKALRLIEPDVSLEAALKSALDQGVLGFYDHETDELVMRGVALDEFVRSTLVHELTHALDDQHFDLDSQELMDGDDSEAQFGFVGLVEGTASWVQDRWVAQLDAAEQRELAAAEAEFAANIDYGSLPNTLLVDISLPYIYGPELVKAIVKVAGTDGIDAAYLEPPGTGAHLFEPGAFLAGESATRVAPPPADGEVVFEGVMGASGLFEMLLATGPELASETAMDWGGDRFVLWRLGDDEACLRADIAGDDEVALDRITRALEQYGAAHGDAEVERRGDLVRVTACGRTSA